MTKLHSDKIKKYTTINVLQLVDRSSGFTGEAVDRLKAFKVEVTNPLPDPGVALDAMEPINAFIGVMENYRSQKLPEDFGKYLNVIYNEFLGYYLDCLEWIMTGIKPVMAEDVEGEIWKYRAQQAVNDFKKPRKDNTNEMLAHLSVDLLKDDLAQKYYNSKRTIPYLIHKFILEKQIAITETIVAICKDFGLRWQDIESRMDQLRNKNISDDATWNAIFTEKENLLERWKTTLTAVGSRK